MSIYSLRWIEFAYVDEDVEFSLAGPPAIVVESANGLPETLEAAATVYVDDGDDDDDIHVHLGITEMKRLPDGEWDWEWR